MNRLDQSPTSDPESIPWVEFSWGTDSKPCELWLEEGFHPSRLGFSDVQSRCVLGIDLLYPRFPDPSLHSLVLPSTRQLKTTPISLIPSARPRSSRRFRFCQRSRANGVHSLLLIPVVNFVGGAIAPGTNPGSKVVVSSCIRTSCVSTR